jgi:hypothetical protein
MDELNTKATPAEKVDSIAFDYFSFPFDLASFFEPLDSLIPQLEVGLQANARAFRENLNGVTSVAWLPAQMAIASVSIRWQIAEKIRDLKTVDPLNHEAVAALAESRARKRLSRDSEVARQVLSELEHSLQWESFKVSASEILRQAIALIWGSFEVLASDVWVQLVNLHPDLSFRLLQNEHTRKWFQPKELLLVLKDYNFDISRNMGDILARWNRLDDLGDIREGFNAIFPDCEPLRTALHQDSLWLLNQRRNLIVHRRGIVDRQYLSMTGDVVEIGQELRITPDYMEASLMETRNAGIDILKASTAQVVA